jgi:hypothetical protein
MYILSYDLRLKTRIDLTAQDEEKFAIKNLEQLKGIRNGREIRLVNYPYGDTKKELKRKFKYLPYNKIEKERP